MFGFNFGHPPPPLTGACRPERPVRLVLHNIFWVQTLGCKLGLQIHYVLNWKPPRGCENWMMWCDCVSWRCILSFMCYGEFKQQQFEWVPAVLLGKWSYWGGQWRSALHLSGLQDLNMQMCVNLWPSVSYFRYVKTIRSQVSYPHQLNTLIALSIGANLSPCRLYGWFTVIRSCCQYLLYLCQGKLYWCNHRNVLLSNVWLSNL